MRENRLRRLLAYERVLLGVHVPFPSADFVEFCGQLGFDWVFIDAEHGVIGVETSQQLVRAADVVGMATVVRVPATTPSVVLGYAESGADAILAPHVMSIASAEELVRAVRYWPGGARGSYSGSRAANWGLTQTPQEYFEALEEHAVPMAMLEDVAAYEEIEQLCAVPGLDMFFLGAGDLAMSMGLPGQAGHPRVLDRLTTAAEVLKANGSVFGAMAATPEAAKAMASIGCRFLAVSAGGLLASAARTYLTETRASLSTLR